MESLENGRVVNKKFAEHLARITNDDRSAAAEHRRLSLVDRGFLDKVKNLLGRKDSKKEHQELAKFTDEVADLKEDLEIEKTQVRQKVQKELKGLTRAQVIRLSEEAKTEFFSVSSEYLGFTRTYFNLPKEEQLKRKKELVAMERKQSLAFLRSDEFNLILLNPFRAALAEVELFESLLSPISKEEAFQRLARDANDYDAVQAIFLHLIKDAIVAKESEHVVYITKLLRKLARAGSPNMRLFLLFFIILKKDLHLR